MEDLAHSETFSLLGNKVLVLNDLLNCMEQEIGKDGTIILTDKKAFITMFMLSNLRSLRALKIFHHRNRTGPRKPEIV